MSSKQNTVERDEAIARLREILKPGDTLHTVIRHVSASGMSRYIDVFHFYVDTDGKIRKSWLSRLISKATGFTFDQKRDSLKIGGCGMDVGFHVVYSLSRVLFPDGFDVAGTGRNGDTSGHDSDGGYALNQEWL